MRNSDFYKELVQELYCASDRRVPHVQEFFKAAGIEPEVFYNGKRTFTCLCIDAGIIPPFSDEEGMEKIVAKAMPKIISMDSPKWIRFIQQSLVHGPVPISAVQKTIYKDVAIHPLDAGLRPGRNEIPLGCLDTPL